MAAVGGWMTIAACSSGGGGKLHDDGSAALDVELPDIVFGEFPPNCPPGAGNDKGVGAPCSHNGGECGGALICTCDAIGGFMGPPNTPCFCSLASISMDCPSIASTMPDFCGQNATCCSYKNMAALCVPNTCLDMMSCPVFTN